MDPHSKHGKKILAFEAFRVGKMVSDKIGKTTIIFNFPHPYQGDDDETYVNHPSLSLCLEGRESSDHPLRAPFTCVASSHQREYTATT